MMLSQLIAESAASVLSAPVFETGPVGCAPGTPPFLNTVMEVVCATPFFPAELLSELRKIETDLGRPTRYPRNAPRSIDLDLLYAGAISSGLPELTLPHPRLAQRRFVLAPLAVIRPDLVLPNQTRSVAELFEALDQQKGVTLYASQW